MASFILLFLYSFSLHALIISAASNYHTTSTLSSSRNSSNHSRHKWVGPSGHRLIRVDVHGLGDFRSVQAAVDSVPEGNRKNVLIQILAGCYIEKVTVPASKPYITFQGEGRDVTVIEWHDRACDRGPTASNSGPITPPLSPSSHLIFLSEISASSTSANAGMQGWQAVAFRISGDKAFFSGCGFYGAQDTLCDDAGRHYFKECYIEGSIDFIFGNGRSMYKDCELHSIATRFGSIAAQDRNIADEKTGFCFRELPGDGPAHYVGRAMGQYSRIVYAYTYFDDVVAHGGWTIGTVTRTMRGVSWARELDYDTAHPFLAKSFVNGRHWISPSDA
ncbi:UNVERIFIED_CONTAM: putative pectinesterase 68 [Sesamum angustifolium]|uniref:Pectinesterase n=1 Tax=Sesamum angustifolium TaxID=2727405 RepID=A0AAW2M8Y6_9LAMI